MPSVATTAGPRKSRRTLVVLVCALAPVATAALDFATASLETEYAKITPDLDAPVEPGQLPPRTVETTKVRRGRLLGIKWTSRKVEHRPGTPMR